MDDLMASCVINSQGRLISANSKFANYISVSVNDIMWHYVFDYFKCKRSWETFRTGMLSNDKFELQTRFRRSNCCSFDGRITSIKLSSTRFKLLLISMNDER